MGPRSSPCQRRSRTPDPGLTDPDCRTRRRPTGQIRHDCVVYRNLPDSLDTPIQSDHGPGPQPVCPRRRAAPPGIGGPRRRARGVRGRAGTGRPRPAGPLDRADRPARRRQDRLAQRHPQRCRPSGLGQRPARGAARPGTNGRRTGPWQPGIDVPAVLGRADSGDIEIDLVELLVDVAGLAAGSGRGIALFIDEMQDVRPQDVSALCAACHELSQQRLPLVLVGAGLPHLPVVLAASKSYSERLFRYHRIDRLDRAAADTALRLPARDEDADFDDEALEAMYAATSGYPYFIQAYGKVAWDVAPRSPITAADVSVAAPQAEAELAVGFFGSRFERATPAEREYLRAMADAAQSLVDGGEEIDETESVPTSAVAQVLDRKPQSLSPARDALLKKGLIYSGERGRIAFTVPHFGRYLRTQG